MPGVVKEYVDATNYIDEAAARFDQEWDVRFAYEENLQQIRKWEPELTYTQAIDRAVDRTVGEILDNYEMHHPDHKIEMAPRQRMGMHL